MPEPVQIGTLTVSPSRLLLIAGPCVLEGETAALSLARALAEIAQAQGVDLVFKASYDKANRTSAGSFRGPGPEEGLRILARIRQETGLPVLSDVHSPQEAEVAGEVLDCLQIPALLSRQTDLLLAAAKTGKAVNIKKGQFMAPEDAAWAVEKVAAHNPNILITERGYAFGYHNLVADMRSLAILRRSGYPVIFDATHSVQLPGGGVQSGGEREFVPVLARAAAGAGVDGLFLEVHPEPEKALSDSATMLRLAELPALLRVVVAIHALEQALR
ncbi:MAG: 3-deoxy-8-phosphooctulonate synthase [Candidatus Firestonebacteria bacterium]|nr:3-deoxy-8-phosphooctulonate synthase [Candidatus Firestonebacteria bacterium]